MKIPPLHVMSFNIRYGSADDGFNSWQYRRDSVAETIRRFGPDLLATQEGLDFQIEYLRKELRGYNCFGVGREDGSERGEYVAIFYREDRFDRLDGGHFWLSETIDIPGSKSWDSSQTRMVTWCRLAERSQQEATFFLFNTHFDQRSEAARHASAELLSRQIQALTQGGAVIVAGDFNSSEDETPYNTLVSGDAKTRGLIDAYRAVHPERLPDELTRHGFCEIRNGSRIDWVLHSNHFTTQAATISRTAFENRLPSDHYPVTATLSLTFKA